MKNKQEHSNQRGSALLMTLGVLALALILAMSFAFTARTNRAISRVNADIIKARLLAQSGLNRLMAAMYHDTVNTPEYYWARNNTLKFNGTIEKDGAAVNFLEIGKDHSDEDQNSLIEILTRHNKYAKKLHEADSSGFAPENFQTYFDSDNKVIGRVGLVVIEESGKLDLNQVLNLSGAEDEALPFIKDTENRIDSTGSNFTNDDFYYNITGEYDPYADDIDEDKTLRLGLNMQEIRVDKKYFDAMPSFNDKKTAWFSYAHLLNSANYGTPTPFNDDVLRYSFFSGEEPEAYWDDTVADPKERERQRFDITGFEWRDENLGSYYDSSNKPIPSNKFIPANSGWQHSDEDKIGDTEGSQYSRDLVELLLKPSQPFWKPGDPNKVNKVVRINEAGDFSGIPWLNKLPQGKQVAANIIDYCDSDSYATTDFTIPSGNATEHPDFEYCGNEKVAYFNEIKIDVIGYRIPDDPLNPTEYEYRFTLRPAIEMVNIFDEYVPAGHCFIRIYGEYIITDNTSVTEKLKNSSTQVGYISFPAWSIDDISALSYDPKKLEDAYLPEKQFFPPDVATPTTPYKTANDSVSIEVKITQVVMYSTETSTPTTSQIYDVGFIDIKHTFDSLQPDDATASIADNPFVYECSDPRCNHLSSSWTKSPYINGTFGEDNETFAPSNNTNNQDIEELENDQLNPDTFSTAFIRNAPMETLWELGAIHRGEAWRTLNLRKFGQSGNYPDGDAMILDQVKISPAKFSRGKYNANAINPGVLQKNFLAGIDLDDNYLKITWPNPEPSGPLPNKAHWLTPPSQHRGSLAEVFSQLGGDNDREIESWIGRSANLLSTRNECFTILVVGQAMQEIFDDSDPINETEFGKIKDTLINPTKYTLVPPPPVDPPTDMTPTQPVRFCSILATQLMQVHIVRDAWRNEYKVVQMRLLED